MLLISHSIRVSLLVRSRYRGNRCITKMKPFDLIGRIDHSSAFGIRHTFFRFRFVSIPRGTDRFDRYYFSTFSFLSFFHGAINFSSSTFPLLLPGEEGPRSTARDPSHRKRTSLRDSRRSRCLPRLINSTTRNKGLWHNKTRCLRITRISPSRHRESSAMSETLVMLCKI